MLVFACIGLETRVVVPVSEFKKYKELYEGYCFYSIPDTNKFYFGYPLYTSKSNIPKKIKRFCEIRAIKTFDEKLYEAIKEREYANKLAKNVMGISLDDPFDIDYDKWFNWGAK